MVWKFFNGSEKAFFLELKKLLPERFHLFSKVRIIDFIEPTDKYDYRWKNYIKSKHIDFLICDFNFKPILAIELNGKSHQRQDRIKRDYFVQKLCDSVNLPLKFINVGENFENSIKDIILKL